MCCPRAVLTRRVGVSIGWGHWAIWRLYWEVGLNLVVPGAGKGKGLQNRLSHQGEHGKMSGLVCAGWHMDWIWVQTQPDSLSGLATLASWEELGARDAAGAGCPVWWQLAGWGHLAWQRGLKKELSDVNAC